MTTIPGYYTAEEIANLFGWKHRQQVAVTAEREGWTAYRVGNVHLYPADEVEDYATARQRTELLKQLGWNGRGLVRADDMDKICPVCSGFAVEASATTEEKTSEKWLSGQWPWRCVNGHQGEL